MFSLQCSTRAEINRVIWTQKSRSAGSFIRLYIDSNLFRECKDPSSCSIQVKLLPSMAPDSLFAPRVDGCALSLLTKSSQEEAEEVALCNICGEARSASGFQWWAFILSPRRSETATSMLATTVCPCHGLRNKPLSSLSIVDRLYVYI